MYSLKILFLSLILLVGTAVGAQEPMPQFIDDGGLMGAGSWSADGNHVAFLARNYLLIYDVHQREAEPRRIAYPFGQALDVAYSPDGRYLATINLHETDGLVLYDAQTLEVVQTFPYTGAVIEWSSDANWLAVADGYQLRLAETETFTVVRESEISQSSEDYVGTTPYRIEFALGDQVAILKYQQTFDFGNHGAEWLYQLFLWVDPEAEIEFSRQQQSLIDDSGRFAFHPDNARIVSSNRDMLNIYDFETGEILHQLTFRTGRHDNYAYSVPVFSPDGLRVAFFKYSYDPLITQIYVWDVETGDPLARVDVAYSGADSLTQQLFFSPDGQQIGFNGQIIEIASEAVTRLASTQFFSSAEVSLAANYMGALHLSQDGGDTWAFLADLDAPLCSVRFSLNVAYFVTVTCDRQGMLWETNTQRQTDLTDVRGVTFSPDSRLMIIRTPHGGYSSYEVWDMHIGQLLRVPLEFGVVEGTFTPDSRVMVLNYITLEPIPYVWNPFETGDAALIALDITGEAIWYFSPSGDYVLREATSDDAVNYLVALDARTGEEINRKALDYESDVFLYNFSFNEEETEVIYHAELIFSTDESYVETWQFR